MGVDMDTECTCEAIKDQMRALAGQKLSSTARLVAVLVSCGVSSTKDLAELTGKSERMVQTARKELREAGCAEAKPVAPPEKGFAKQIAEPEADCASSRTHARAQMEYPSGIDINLVASSSAPEMAAIPGLNGSTRHYVDLLAGWLAGPLSVKDLDASRSILFGSVDRYGADAVRTGMLELQTLMAGGGRPRDVGKAFSGFVKKAAESRPGQQRPMTKTEASIAKARSLLSPEARADLEARERARAAL
jgi:hypothetical protein